MVSLSDTVEQSNFRARGGLYGPVIFFFRSHHNFIF